MRDLYKIATECMYELDLLGIPYAEIPKSRWTVNTRAKSFVGETKRVNGNWCINISVDILHDNYPLDYLKNTIIHELLHTCDGCFNHGNEWKAYAKKVNDAYGYKIQRCTSDEEQNAIEKVAPTPKGKYGIKCPKCGYTWEYNRMCKSVKYPSLYNHKKCNRATLVRAW